MGRDVVIDLCTICCCDRVENVLESTADGAHDCAMLKSAERGTAIANNRTMMEKRCNFK
jgi:magnesium-transporting ATPase (P-type)